MLEVEVVGAALLAGAGGERGHGFAPDGDCDCGNAPGGEGGLGDLRGAGDRRESLSRVEIERLCERAVASAGLQSGHVAVEFVTAVRIAQLNAEHRGKPGATDVLSFPIDGAVPDDGSPRELGDVVICPQHTVDLREAVVHGVLHLLGMDHETDDGEMLALQAELLRVP